MLPEVEENYRSKKKADFQAYAAVISQFLNQSLDFTNSIKRISVPCLIYAGEMDPLVTVEDHSELSSYRNLVFKIIPKLDHAEGFFNVEVVAPTVISFLNRE